MREVFSSATLSGNRQRGWREVIGRLYADVDIKLASRQNFQGAISRLPIGPLEFTEVQTDTEIAHRTRRHVASAKAANFLYLQVREGELLIEQFRRDCRLRPGQFALIDLNSPFVFSHQGLLRKVAVKLPADALGARLSRPHDHCVIAHASDRGMGRVLADFLATIHDEGDAVAEPLHHGIAANIVDLIGLACGSPDMLHGPDDTGTRSAIRRRAIAHIDAHAGDADLDPAQVAAALGISLRHLHQCFASGDMPVNATIVRRRLELCRRDLEDPRYAALSIAEVAARRGLRNAAHFSDAFRKAFGQSPRDHRLAVKLRRAENS